MVTENLDRWFVRLLARSGVHSFVRSLARVGARLLVCSCGRAFVRLLARAGARLLVRFAHSFDSFARSLARSALGCLYS